MKSLIVPFKIPPPSEALFTPSSIVEPVVFGARNGEA
jgi:hypothetical protein